MPKKPARGGIERKFLTSILWVGVIPMTLALIIGYVFAREGQQIAVQERLADAARKTAEGVRLTVEARALTTARTAQNAEIIAALRDRARDAAPDLDALLTHLKRASKNSGILESTYAVYDRTARLVLATEDLPELDHHRPEWLEKTGDPGVSLAHDVLQKRFAMRVTVRVNDPASGEFLGFLAETQGIAGLIEFILGEGREEPSQDTLYDVVLTVGEFGFAAYMERSSPDQPPGLEFVSADQDFIDVISRASNRESGSAFIAEYLSRGRQMPALMAYHRLMPELNVYIVVYRSASEVFRNINLAALLTIVLSGLVIAFFCVFAYRNINNNLIRPLSLLNEGAQIIRQGDLELKLIIGTGDEIEELATSFNEMASALRHNIRQLGASEEKYRSLIAAMRDGICQTDPEGAITLINPAGVEILGYASADDVISANVRRMFVEESDYARVAGEFSQDRFIERTRAWMLQPSGRRVCIELSGNRVFDDHGVFIGLEIAFRDVTETVRLEQEARERSERITVINQIANAINSSLEAGRVYESIVAEVRKLVHFDYAAVSLLDGADTPFETRQLWPEPPPGAKPAARSDGDASCAAWVARERRCLIVDALRAGGSPFAHQFPPEIESCVCLPLHATGRIIGTLNLGAGRTAAYARHEIEILEQLAPHVAVAIRNAKLLENLQQSLEEVTRARERLHDANEELKSLDEMKTNLLSNVSHELRTPLVAVMGYTDMILNGKAGVINDVQREYLGISLRNIEKLVTLIENLLDFSRLHRGQEELVFDVFDLVDCARMSMQVMEPVAATREIRLSLDASSEKILVEGDKGKMGQVFNNLLANAVKFNHKGGTVAINITADDDEVTATVSDTGIGIPEEALDKIFTRFYQYDASSTRKYGGTGIGLAIAQDIMRLHGSRITVTSTVGKGSVFRFSLPLSPAQKAERDGLAHELPLPTETHLLIEVVTQDRALSAQIRNYLLSEGMDIIHASYPAVAVSLAIKYNPDCILVDTEAGPLGSVVVDEILSDPSASNMPIVLLTNDDDLFNRYRHQVASRVKSGFRKSSLLSGIHYALSRGLRAGEQLGPKVLCVDDDPEIATFIARCLQGEGFQTDFASSGEAAIDMAQTGDYWLVLLDVAMPGIDGWETCDALRADPRLAGMKIYIVTAKPVEKIAARVHDCGADGYLLKPFKAEDLLLLVQEFHDRAPAR